MHRIKSGSVGLNLTCANRVGAGLPPEQIYILTTSDVVIDYQVSGKELSKSIMMIDLLNSLDLSWNMGAESQAYDRAHRIGQSKTVHVKRFIIKDTIEEK